MDRLGKGHDNLPKIWKAAVENKHSDAMRGADVTNPQMASSVDTLTTSVRRLDITPCSKAADGQDSESDQSTRDDQAIAPVEGLYSIVLRVIPGAPNDNGIGESRSLTLYIRMTTIVVICQIKFFNRITKFLLIH